MQLIIINITQIASKGRKNNFESIFGGVPKIHRWIVFEPRSHVCLMATNENEKEYCYHCAGNMS